MPFVHLRIAAPELSAQQRRHFQAGLTELMAQILHKQADLTVVAVDHMAPEAWTVGGRPIAPDAWTAQLDAYVTAGTNTSAERGAFLAAANVLIRAQWASPPATPLYALVHEVHADSWGYDGATQEARRLVPGPAPRTLRQLSGAASAPPLRAQDCALVLIDFQHEYLDGGLPLPGLREAAAQAAHLAAAADASGVPVIHVHHEAPLAARFFAQGGAGVQPLAEPAFGAAHHRVVKTLPSAFCATDLAALLERLQRKTLVLAGCMTHNCVDSTAREALHRRYQVVVVADACATRALPGVDGAVVPAQEIHRMSLAALADRHADVLHAQGVRLAWAAPAA